MANRIFLDWKLNTTEERRDFVANYLKEIKFVPNEEELEILSNYILWGKDPDGLNVTQRGEI